MENGKNKHQKIEQLIVFLYLIYMSIEDYLNTLSANVRDITIPIRFQLSSLPPLTRFTNLQSLHCSNNKLTSLPELPNSLTKLFCDGNELTSLPELPNSLTELTCEDNKLTSLPALAKLNSLIILYCSYNPLTSLPILPDSLTELICEDNQLTFLPTLPKSLTELHCNVNQLTTLPALIKLKSLTELTCNANQLIGIPALPNSLTELSCNANQLTALPALPNSLNKLSCNANQLTALPALPNSLTELSCNNNELRTLPALPNSLLVLDCDTNLHRFLTPAQLQRLRIPTANAPAVNAMQVHQEFAKLNIPAILAFFQSQQIPPPPSTFNVSIPNYIQTQLQQLIQSNNTEQTQQLENIMRQRLANLDYNAFNNDIKSIVYYSIAFVHLQPSLFQETYIQNFLTDCVNAYNGSDGMSCAQGALERLFTSLESAAVACLTSNTGSSSTYQSLLNLFASPTKIIEEGTKDWFVLHKNGGADAFPTTMSMEEKKENLRTYLLSKFMHPTPTITDLIARKIEELEGIDMFDSDYFEYSGGKRKRRQKKTGKTGKMKTRINITNKNKTRKNKTRKNKTRKNKTRKNKTRKNKTRKNK